MGNFGNKFRKARESKKLSFDDVSNVTKIGSRMLKAIEEEDFDQLPGGVFNKGFIRSYAKHLGIDPEDAVNDYLALLQARVDSQGDTERLSGSDRRKPAPSTAPTSNGVSKTQNSAEVEQELPGLHLPRAEDIRGKPKEYLDRPSSGIPWLTIAVLLVIALTATLFWVRHSRRARSTKPAAPVVTAGEFAPPSRIVSGPTQSAPSLQTSPAITTSTQARPEAAKLQNAKMPEGVASDMPASAVPGPTTSGQPKVDKAAAAETSIKPAGTLTLVIRASENSWISVTSDGQLVTQETLIAPAHTTIHGNREIVVRVGNSGGVTFNWKGQEIPAQGAEGEVKTLTFDAEGLHLPALSPN